MSEVVADISVSLDGFVTGPGPSPDQGLGDGGEALHAWAFDTTDETDVAVLGEATETSGAVIMGRRLFDFIDGPHGWSDELGYGARLATTPPFFVVTHAAPLHVRLPLDFSFIVDGVSAAVAQARDAGRPGNVVIMGGANVIAQALNEGVVDELRLHLAPLVLGAGTALFAGVGRLELVQSSVRASSNAVHLVYRRRS